MPDAADKSSLREYCKQQRKALTDAQRQDKSLHIIRNLTVLCARISPVKHVALYHAMDVEANVLPLSSWCEMQGISVSLPCVDIENQPLVFRAYQQGDPLLLHDTLPFLQPERSAEVVQPDVVVIPVVGFDAKGGRLGYGGGYYDRTLEKLRDGRVCVAVGVAFSCQQVDSLKVEAHDQPLDYLVTEDSLFDFTK